MSEGHPSFGQQRKVNFPDRDDGLTKSYISYAAKCIAGKRNGMMRTRVSRERLTQYIMAQDRKENTKNRDECPGFFH